MIDTWRKNGLNKVAGILSLLMLAPSIALAQAYPVKPVRILIPFPPGGPSDYAARVVGAKLSEYLGQTVIADNRPGAGGIVATELGARATPDEIGRAHV